MQKFNVKVTLYTTEAGRGARVFIKEMEAPDEAAAQEYVRQFFEGFLDSSVTMETKIVPACDAHYWR